MQLLEAGENSMKKNVFIVIISLWAFAYVSPDIIEEEIQFYSSISSNSQEQEAFCIPKKVVQHFWTLITTHFKLQTKKTVTSLNIPTTLYLPLHETEIEQFVRLLTALYQYRHELNNQKIKAVTMRNQITAVCEDVSQQKFARMIMNALKECSNGPEYNQVLPKSYLKQLVNIYSPEGLIDQDSPFLSWMLLLQIIMNESLMNYLGDRAQIVPFVIAGMVLILSIAYLNQKDNRHWYHFERSLDS